MATNRASTSSAPGKIIATTVVLALATAAFGADRQSAGAQIAYIHPENFTDVGDNGRVTTDARRDALLGQLTRHIEERAARRIPAGSTLSVTVFDIDMAGDFEPWRGPRADHVRIVRDVYPPRIKLDFKLVDTGGKIVAEGRRELTDLAFMTTVEYRSDLLRYEKKLLDDWLVREFRDPLHDTR